MKISSKLTLRLFLAVFVFGFGPIKMAYPGIQDTLLVHYDVYQCDSLIQANATNPDFVILDVRTSGEHLYAHLLGAINRNYYASNFSQLIDALPRHKMYLIHCRSGGRSGNTFNMMVGMDFAQVINMQGGIMAWNAASLPTTTGFAPLLMAVSDTTIANETIAVGDVDTIALTITNRANSNLSFNSISSLTGTEFSTDFELSTTLTGAEDYTFSIFYEPLEEISDTLEFLIESNGGGIAFYIYRTGIAPAEFTITLATGWSGISSFVVPDDPNVENIFAPVVDELVVLQNFDGVYWPDAGVNSIGNWNDHAGYMIKMETEQQLTFTGEMQTNRTVMLSAGWNYLPVLNVCESNTADLFSQISGSIKIVKEIAGGKVYWPEYGIATLDVIVPGKAYFVLVDEDVVVEFSECP
jgi:rhodanese-related sulfurtransferase